MTLAVSESEAAAVRPSESGSTAPDTRPTGKFQPTPEPKQVRLSWLNILFLTFVHGMAMWGLVYMVAVKFSPWTLALALLWFAFSGFAVTAGYHRLFSHQAYQARAPLRLFQLLFGAAAVQNSALKWSADHRVHHRFTDQEQDPYNIRRGFFFAHVGWIFLADDCPGMRLVKDLEKDPLVRFQDRYYVPLAILMGAVLPASLGLIWGDPLGALLVAGFLRLAVQWHATFCVNSVAHCIGNQPYSTRTSARDSFWTALVTMGEGYHNFHHHFPRDYRNGVRWWQFDPTKWTVYTLSKLGLTRRLKRTPPHAIREARERMRVAREEANLSRRLAS